MKSLKIEQNYPKILGLIASVLGIVFLSYGFLPCVSSSLLSAGITVGAIFAGFDAVHKTLIMSLDSPSLKKIRRTAYYNDLLNYTKSNLISSLSFIIISFIALLMLETPICNELNSDTVQNKKNLYFLPHIVTIIWIYLGVYMCASFFRINSIFTIIIRTHRKN